MDYIIPVVSIILGAFAYYLIGCASYKTKGFGMFWLFCKTAVLIEEKIEKEIPSIFFFVTFGGLAESIEDGCNNKGKGGKIVFLFLWPCPLIVLSIGYTFLLTLYFFYVTLFLACRICFRLFIQRPYDWATNQSPKNIG